MISRRVDDFPLPLGPYTKVAVSITSNERTLDDDDKKLAR